MRGIQKSFGTTRAVQDIDLEVRASEIVALMGGNGAGKSTLMKIVGGLVVPDVGRVELLGGSVGDDGPRRGDGSRSTIRAPRIIALSNM